jgi:hypothetical protein
VAIRERLEKRQKIDHGLHIEPRGKAIIPTKAAAKVVTSTKAAVANQEKRDPRQEDDFFSKGLLLRMRNLFSHVLQPAARIFKTELCVNRTFCTSLSCNFGGLIQTRF